jgi:hypothetical protein
MRRGILKEVTSVGKRNKHAWAAVLWNHEKFKK